MIMDSLIGIALFWIAWFIIMGYILPKLGRYRTRDKLPMEHKSDDEDFE